MAFKKHWVITLKKLNSALADVRAELDKFGFWNPRLANIDVYLTWFGSAYGWQHYRTSGDIEITAFSLCRLCEAIPGSESVPLRDIVRHEYAHAIADGNRGLMRSSQFRRAFGKHHDSDSPSVYSPDMHVSKYAAEDAGEDFAEVSMCYLKYSGKLQTSFAGGPDPIPNLNGTFMVTTASLPVGALSLYEYGADASVFAKAEGSGSVVGIGYDWYDGQSTPLAMVLDSAVMFSTIPEPTTLTLVTLGLLSLTYRRRK